MFTPNTNPVSLPQLRLLPYNSYARANHNADPLRFYYWPLLGRVYRKRVEQCLAQCRGGQRILEVGFGSGVTFLNLHELYEEIYGVDLCSAVAEVAETFKRRGITTHLRSGNVLDLPYPENCFDSVLLVSILEHLTPCDLARAVQEVHRVLKPRGQMVYGVPIDRPLMVFLFRLLCSDIRRHHFSTEQEVRTAANGCLTLVTVNRLKTWLPFVGAVYEVGHFVKNA